ncbi:LysM domain-containing protein [Blastococcus sp. HT6-30]|uniref:LysM peptidoglycan-binding domain-containing protein n=1 Tax=Blastococcus sp. HT6-30 TaxID=3144843 RepID=UPI00321A02C3
MRNRSQGRHRAARTSAVAVVARPAAVLAAASALSFTGLASAAAHTGEHTVQPGDTLSSLAAAHGTSWQTVYDVNRATIGANPNVLRVGQALSIGGSAPVEAAPSTAASSYTVQAGDTLGRIAARHGITWQQLHALNLQVIGPNANVLRVGQRLALSGGGGPAAVVNAPVPRASRAERPAAAPAAYDVWAPHVRPAVQEVAERFGIPTVLTRPGHSPTQDRAADFMVYDDRAAGDAIAQYVIDNAARFGVDYVIWQQRIAASWTGWAWQGMADRGSPTANHMDHPHVAFRTAG